MIEPSQDQTKEIYYGLYSPFYEDLNKNLQKLRETSALCIVENHYIYAYYAILNMTYYSYNSYFDEDVEKSKKSLDSIQKKLYSPNFFFNVQNMDKLRDQRLVLDTKKELIEIYEQLNEVFMYFSICFEQMNLTPKVRTKRKYDPTKALFTNY